MKYMVRGLGKYDVREKTFEEVRRLVGEEVDEAFFSPIFSQHLLIKDKKTIYIAKEENSDD